MNIIKDSLKEVALKMKISPQELSQWIYGLWIFLNPAVKKGKNCLIIISNK
jgi:hypothetical protein